MLCKWSSSGKNKIKQEPLCSKRTQVGRSVCQQQEPRAAQHPGTPNPSVVCSNHGKDFESGDAVMISSKPQRVARSHPPSESHVTATLSPYISLLSLSKLTLIPLFTCNREGPPGCELSSVDPLHDLPKDQPSPGAERG